MPLIGFVVSDIPTTIFAFVGQRGSAWAYGVDPGELHVSYNPGGWRFVIELLQSDQANAHASRSKTTLALVSSGCGVVNKIFFELPAYGVDPLSEKAV